MCSIYKKIRCGSISKIYYVKQARYSKGTLFFNLFPPLCSDYAHEVFISLPPFPKTFSGLLRLS